MEVAAFPIVAFTLLACGLLLSVVHLMAMPGLFLWENAQERRSTRRLKKFAHKEVE
jgi:nicotinamide riboside transporter PnuC